MNAAPQQPPALRPTHVPCRPWPLKSYLTTDQWNYVHEHMPELDLYASPAGMKRMNHPVSALERAYCEQLAIENLYSSGAGRIHDVGGAVGRHAGRLWPPVQVWCSRPELNAEDMVKNESFRDAGHVNFCDHLGQDCQCREFDAALSVHSLYYLSPSDIAAIIDNTHRKLLIAVHHVFENAVDYWWPRGGAIVLDTVTPTHKYSAEPSSASNDFEAAVLVLGDCAEMSVVGQSTLYRHSDLSWLRATAHALPDGRTLIWQTVRRVGHTVTTEFRITDQPTPANPLPSMDLELAVRDPSYYGSVTLKAASVGVDKSIPHALSTLRSCGSWFTTVDCVVPKSLLTNIRTSVAGFERTPQTLNRCLDLTGKHLKDVNMPDSLKPRAKIVCGYLAFLADVDLERHMMLNHVRPADNAVAHLNEERALQPALSTLGRLWQSLARADTEHIAAGAGLACGVGLVAHECYRRLVRPAPASFASTFNNMMVRTTLDGEVVVGTRLQTYWLALKSWARRCMETMPSASVHPDSLRRHMKVGLLVNFYTIVGAPIFEEHWKRIPYLRWLIFLEPLNHLREAITPGQTDGFRSLKFGHFLQTLILHSVTMPLEIRLAIIIHMSWNAFAVVMQSWHAFNTTLAAQGDFLSLFGAGWRFGAAVVALFGLWRLVRSYVSHNYPLFRWTDLLTRPKPSDVVDAAAHYRRTRESVRGSAYYVEHFDKLVLPDTTNPPSQKEAGARCQARCVPEMDQGPERPDALQAVGIVNLENIPCVSSSTFDNESRALVARQGTLEFMMTKQEAALYRATVLDLFADVYAEIGQHMKVPPFEWWAARFPPRRMEQLTRALRLVLSDGLQPNDFVIDAFVKKEKVNKSEPWNFEDYDPRCISAFRDKFVAATGPWLFAVQKALGESLGPESVYGLFYTSAHGAAVIGEWMSRNWYRLGRRRMTEEKTNVISVTAWTQDYSRLDGNLSPEVMAPAEVLYDRLGKGDTPREAVRRVHKQSFSKMKHGPTLSRSGGMQSGRADTNARDVLECLQLNAVGFYRAQPDPDWGLRDRTLAMCGTGDDAIGATCLVDFDPSAMQDKIGTDLGMPLTMDHFEMEYQEGYWTNIHRLEYCSSLFWPALRPVGSFEEDADLVTPPWDTHGWVLGPKPGRILARLGWDITGAHKPDVHMRGIALGLQDDCWHVPFAHEFISRILAVTEKLGRVPVTHEREGRRPHVDRRYEYHPTHTWRLVWDRYGLTHSDLRGFIAQLRQVTSLPCAINSSVIARLIQVDLEKEARF